MRSDISSMNAAYASSLLLSFGGGGAGPGGGAAVAAARTFGFRAMGLRTEQAIKSVSVVSACQGCGCSPFDSLSYSVPPHPEC